MIRSLGHRWQKQSQSRASELEERVKKVEQERDDAIADSVSACVEWDTARSAQALADATRSAAA
jgi:hypothetical protein